MKMISGIRNTDVFVAFNVALFLFMCCAVYYDRFVKYRGPGNIHEFFIYACTILLAIGVGWLYLRRVRYPRWMLILMQIGILAHFAGAFVPIEGGRLYDAYVLGMRYDKYVHAYNAFAGAALLNHLFNLTKARLPLRPFMVVAVVLGLGSVVEIMEYIVMQTVPNAGVGGYDNNLQDLISNLTGGVLYVAFDRAAARARKSRRETR